MIDLIFVLATTFLGSLLLIFGWIKIAHRMDMIDVPNARSSHQHPTPRGGGIGFITATFVGILGWFGNLALPWLFVPALGIAAIGAADDLKSLSPRRRFLFQILGASATVWWGKLSLQVIAFPTVTFLFSPQVGGILAVFFIVSMINIYNFMDGIDALAGGLGVISCVFFGIYFMQTGQMDWAVIQMILGAALLGFLIWNYPKAKIFMGDVGAYFLGFYFAILILIVSQGPDNVSIFVPTAWLSVIGVDASITILIRMIKRKKIWEAHKEHFFQKLHLSGWEHQQIIWLEYAHLIAVGSLGLVYLHTTSTQLQWLILVAALGSFVLKFMWIESKWKLTR